jgi:hypothetical protein
VNILVLAAALLATIGWQDGGITYYYEQFVGRELYCGNHRYEPETGPWLALDVSEYESGRARCGDVFLVEFYDGTTMLARALDAGYLYAYEDGVWDTGLPFVADLPYYWREGRVTATGRILNLSAAMREMETLSPILD